MPDNLGGKIDLKLERIRSTVTGKDGKLVDGSISEYLKYKECQPEEFEGSSPIELTSSEIYKNYERFCKRTVQFRLPKESWGLTCCPSDMRARNVQIKGTATLIRYGVEMKILATIL